MKNIGVLQCHKSIRAKKLAGGKCCVKKCVWVVSWTRQGWLQHECQVAVSSMRPVRHARRSVLRTWFAAVVSRTCCWKPIAGRSYVAPKSPKWGLKNAERPFSVSNRTSLEESLLQSSSCEKCQREICKAFIVITIRATMIGGRRTLLPEI